MKLIEQISLWNREGSSDKVYEVDLWETSPNQYVVNFRYGRRGAPLKDGTKTTLPVSLTDGIRIFNQLVNEKKKGGYQQAAHFKASETEAASLPPSGIPTGEATTDKRSVIISSLQKAAQPSFNDKKWPLSRIIWRAGELKIKEATPLLIPLLLKSDALQQYCICWSLGRCGDAAAIPVLEQVYQAAATKDFVRRMAFTSILALENDAHKRRILANNWVQNISSFLEKASTGREQQSGQESGGFSAFWRKTSGQMANPTPSEQPGVDPVLEKISTSLKQAIESGKDGALADILKPVMGKDITYSILESMYLFSVDFPKIRPAVIYFLQTIPFKPGSFKTVRHIFKTAEFREDADIFALLLYRIEKEKPYFAYGYSREYGVRDASYNYIQSPVKELQKPNARLAYSKLTSDYFKRRGWRTLRILGEDGQEAYISMASAVLLSISDTKDKAAAREARTDTWHYDSQTRRHTQHVTITQYDTYANWLTFNYILYQNSPRYELKQNNKAWRCKEGYLPGQPAPDQREEAFPELWDKYPKALLHLLLTSDNNRVHEFAVRALKGRTDLKELMDLDTLVQLLSRPHPETVKLALAVVNYFYNPQNPNLKLIRMLIHSPLPEAHLLVQQWIEAQPEYFLRKTLIFADLIVNPYEEIWVWVRQKLATTPWEEENAKMLAGRVIAELLALPADNELANIAAAGAAQTLLDFFLPLLEEINLDVAQDLLKHPLPGVQTLGAVILLHHRTAPEHLPAGLLSSLIQSTVPAVREAGIKLFGKLPESTLLGSFELITAFCLSPFAEIRKAIRPTVATLATTHDDFGKQLLFQLLPFLQHKETYAGLQEDLYTLFTTVLHPYLVEINQEQALQMLHAGKGMTQQLGLFLLTKYINPANLTVRQIVRMASHETLAVRQWSWQTYTNDPARMRSDAEEALRILDARWEDSRQFAFDFFRTHFTADEWTPTLLISVCDSTRPDVQSFGRELITKFFNEENGETYLLQLSQHPVQTVQVFATNFLEQFATDNLQNITQLEYYFTTVLSQVNRSGAAKARIFSFLRKEALKHQTIAQLITDLMARQSVTMAVADKAACIEIMRDLSKKYPELQMPLVIKNVAARQVAVK
ncbi:WGR domain-containing protein [Rhodocytophaga aerolata]|uniref:WGR domain-containing protein n=1 Tax=Rhodocytophaga aerolata TaxID=455078 RepID=A0ABT8R0Q1_9BACT|nr:WGR domain-containing protein [Rhodocytophaga aerolata]MDO1445504.1 WGR domain-containing protein [Rhodocytophaga aerolata]